MSVQGALGNLVQSLFDIVQVSLITLSLPFS